MVLIVLAVIGILTLALCIAIVFVLHAIAVDRQISVDLVDSPPRPRVHARS